jgi:hypothetical protein
MLGYFSGYRLEVLHGFLPTRSIFDAGRLVTIQSPSGKAPSAFFIGRARQASSLRDAQGVSS